MTQRCAWLASVAALLLATAPASAARIDDDASRVGFTLKTRWGQTLEGRFPVFDGEIRELDDGQRQVAFALSSREVEIVDNDSYTRLTRGKGFFDAERYPEVSFVSDPYPESLLRRGGALSGVLTIRGVQRREVFTVMASACPRPARDCDVVASGAVQRSDYGVDRWAFALGDSVRFQLRIRTAADPA